MSGRHRPHLQLRHHRPRHARHLHAAPRLRPVGHAGPAVVFSTATGDGSFDCTFPDDARRDRVRRLDQVSITITDDDTGAGTGTLNVTVNNVAPTVVITGPTNVNESQTLRTYAFDTTDVGTLDTFTAGTPDCGAAASSSEPSSSAPSPATATSTAASPMTTRPAPPRI